jgi:hypothetical protein
MLKFFMNKKEKSPSGKKISSEIDFYFEKKIKDLGRDAFQKEFVKFQKTIGEVRPHEPLYETFVDYYLNCFLFENEKRSSVPFSFMHSLFRVIKNRENFLVVKDFLSKKTFSLTSDSFTFHGVLPNSFVQGFVFDYNGGYSLGKGFIVYEPDKKSFIQNFHKKLEGGVSHHAFLRHLVNIKLSSERNSQNKTVFKMKVDNFFK